MNQLKRWLKDKRSQLGFLLSCSVLIAACSNDLQKEKDLQLHQELESIKIQVELHLVNNELDSASTKLKRLVHPSSASSHIEYRDDLTTKEGWSEALSRQSNVYSYNEYWSMQRSELLEDLKNARAAKVD